MALFVTTAYAAYALQTSWGTPGSGQGQFSIPSVTFASFATPATVGQTSRNVGQLASTGLRWSRPTNVLTTPTPRRGAAAMTFFKCSMTV